MDINQMVWLILTLLSFDSEMMGNFFSYCLSSELVFATAKIQMHRSQEVLIYSRLGNSHNARMPLSYQQQTANPKRPTRYRFGRRNRKYHRKILAKRKFKRKMLKWLAAEARRRVRIERMLQMVQNGTWNNV